MIHFSEYIPVIKWHMTVYGVQYSPQFQELSKSWNIYPVDKGGLMYNDTFMCD
jgi:hypothetical protein